jgi:hypothetical protein
MPFVIQEPLDAGVQHETFLPRASEMTATWQEARRELEDPIMAERCAPFHLPL